jgi:hypothetical protein
MKAYQKNVWNIKNILEDKLSKLRNEYNKELRTKSPNKDKVLKLAKEKEVITSQLLSLVYVYDNHHDIIDMVIYDAIDTSSLT